ncbi:hypothetical protein PTKIN_Ptkin05aG0072700 [Pterospermum kingtungense]
MDSETREKIKKTVREILEEADMDEMTEYKIRQLASRKLDLNLSDSKYKAYVRHVVNSFLEEQKAKQEEEEEADATDNNDNQKEFDDEGDLIVCRVCFFLWVFFYFGFSVYWFCFVLFFLFTSCLRREG